MSNILPQLNTEGLSNEAKIRLLIAQAGIGLYLYVRLFEGRDFLSWLWDLLSARVW